MSFIRSRQKLFIRRIKYLLVSETQTDKSTYIWSLSNNFVFNSHISILTLYNAKQTQSNFAYRDNQISIRVARNHVWYRTRKFLHGHTVCQYKSQCKFDIRFMANRETWIHCSTVANLRGINVTDYCSLCYKLAISRIVLKLRFSLSGISIYRLIVSKQL